MRALLIDAYDSFICIIDQYLRASGIDTTVVRNDTVTPEGVGGLAPDFVVLGPGPGHPADAGYVELIRAHRGRIPLLGVCLGHQAIGLAYGGTVGKAPQPRHGKTPRPCATTGAGSSPACRSRRRSPATTRWWSTGRGSRRGSR